MRPLRLFALTLTAPLLGFIAAAATPLPTSGPLGEVISLPEFKVYEDRPLPAPEKWDYVRVGNFEILSNTSKSTTKRFARDLNEFQNVLAIVSPHMLIRAEQPVIIILCGKNNAAAAFEVKSVIPSAKGRGTSLVRDNEIASIIVDYQTKTVPVDGAVVVPPQNLGGGEPWYSDWFATSEVYATEEFIRQYIHLSMSQMTPRPAPWVAEGLANIYSALEYNNKWIEIGRPRAFLRDIEFSSSGVGSIYNNYSGFNSMYSYADTWGGPYSNPSPNMFGNSFAQSYRAPFYVMPLSEMFAVGYNSSVLSGAGRPYDSKSPNWKTQVTAFVHMCLYGERGRYRQGFLKFASGTAAQPPTEEFFKECFGISYKEMAIRIRGYTDFTDSTGMIIEAKKGTTLYPLAPVSSIRAANEAEIGRIKGETFRLSGHDDSASREFVVAYLRGERDPQLLASLGLMARQRKDDARARTYLEAVGATPTPVPRPRAYLELARLRAAQLTAKNGARPYSIEEMTFLLTPLFVAQKLPQQLSDIYLEIAGVWEHGSVTPTRDNIGALEYGIRLFPYHGPLILRTAGLQIKYGYKSDAAALIQRTLNLTREPEMKRKLEELQKQIDSNTSARAAESPSRFSPEANLGPELRQRLTEYRVSRAGAVAELRSKLESVEKLSPAKREEALIAFATAQGSRLRALESEASRLEADLGWPPDEGDDYAPGLATVGAGLSPESRQNLGLLANTLQRPQGLSPPQVGLIREMFLDARDGASNRGAFFFFSPETTRVRLPASLPGDLATQLSDYTREKDALKAELRGALVSSENIDSDLVRGLGLGALAEQQSPRFAALEKRAEEIRQALALLPSRTSAGGEPALPPALAARLAEYQRKRTELQLNSRRDLRALRSSLPPASGAELTISGDGSRLSLKTPPNASPAVLARIMAVDSFNKDYAERSAALDRELVELRRLLADVARPASASASQKSVTDLMQDFTAAALRQTSAETYRDCRVAALQPGLSPEQRRLLFDRTAEKQPAFVIEF
jgi:hypothetical protein